MIRIPSPAMCVACLSLLVALGGAGYSATGGSFILGQGNTASSQTRLTTPLAGTAFRIDNTNTQNGATALGLFVGAGRTPFTVNSEVKVAKLNADKLDGLDSTALTRKRVINFTLGAFQTSASIALPANTHVVMVASRTIGPMPTYVSLLSLPGEHVGWTGLDSKGEIKWGGSSADGTVIAYLDQSDLVQVQVNDSTSIQVYNNNGVPESGQITLLW